MFFSVLLFSALFPLLWLHQRGRPQPVAIKREKPVLRHGQIGGRLCPKSF